MTERECSTNWAINHWLLHVELQQARFLIHKAHLGKILRFCKISDLKITHLEIIFYKYFCLIFAILIQAWHSKKKNFYTTTQNCVYFLKNNFQNLCQKHKWALWMRYKVLAAILKFVLTSLVFSNPFCLFSLHLIAM